MIAFNNIKTNQGHSLEELSRNGPILLVFLRSFECLFCKEALAEFSLLSLKPRGIHLVLVHMEPSDKAKDYFESFNIKDYNDISDPSKELYASFGLGKAGLGQLLGLSSWVRGNQIRKSGLSPGLQAWHQAFQMPGIFVICDGEIKSSFIHKKVSDRPDYEELLKCCSI